ncbi:MAG: hypothetical protein GY847_11420 [Proteobacteria bacterium]|nr:hypothetical protein [Pseudomonadota bacterium]
MRGEDDDNTVSIIAYLLLVLYAHGFVTGIVVTIAVFVVAACFCSALVGIVVTSLS